MLKHIFATAITAALLTTTAPVFAETMVKDVTVQADLTAIQNAKAGEHWATLTDDLQNAIVSRLGALASDDGATLNVEINSVELANTLQSAAGVADSKLIGKVSVTSETDNSKFESYDLTVTFADASLLLVQGTDLAKITSDSKEYYDAMIAAFADHVIAKLM